MAIVILIKNEKLNLFEDVLCGIPNECITIIVSGSEITSGAVNR
jgi:Mannosyl-3-phosphoglycerate synthase (osmo_MPGsynth)